MSDPGPSPNTNSVASGDVSLYYQFGKLLIWIVGAIISLCVTIFLAALAIPGVKQDIDKNVIVDAQDETRKYLGSDAGIKSLETEIDNYLHSSKATDVVDNETRKYLLS